MKDLLGGLACLAAMLACPVPATAGLGPENVVVVVNPASADSVAVAREYVRLRGIPACNVIELRDVPAGHTVTVQAFREQVLRPILKQIAERGLASQIEAIAYSAGFPYAVDTSADMAGKPFPRYITQPASITGLTYLYEPVLAADIDYLSLQSNRYFRRPGRGETDAAWSAGDKQRQRETSELLTRVQAALGDRSKAPSAEALAMLREAETVLRSLRQGHPGHPETLYDLACVLSVQGKQDEAMAALHAAHTSGWRNATLTEADSDLTALKQRDDFKQLMTAMRTEPVAIREALAFSHADRFAAGGAVTEAPDGRAYYLSAMLAYTGGPTNTLDESLASLRRSAAADGTRPAGTVYFMESTDWARTGPRQWAFGSAASALKKLGVNAEVIKGVLPEGKADVAGAVIGIATFDWKASGSTILPGAFLDHLTSCGGIMAGGGGQTLLSEFIRNGAAGSCGTVTEPYNLQAKFPNPFLHVYYAQGCTLAEAFYQSIGGPYQQLLVADPLCRPWGVAPSVSVTGVKEGQAIAMRRSVTVKASGMGPFGYRLFIDGVARGPANLTGRFILDPKVLSPGAHELRFVAAAGPAEVTGRKALMIRVTRPR